MPPLTTPHSPHNRRHKRSHKPYHNLRTHPTLGYQHMDLHILHDERCTSQPITTSTQRISHTQSRPHHPRNPRPRSRASHHSPKPHQNRGPTKTAKSRTPILQNHRSRRPHPTRPNRTIQATATRTDYDWAAPR
ncbi:Hypothetical protein Cul131001_0181 [Corynebacterium ulcerans]|nr:Hypothetical protein Cul131001_0181 [Corynebacterium ulcerans]